MFANVFDGIDFGQFWNLFQHGDYLTVAIGAALVALVIGLALGGKKVPALAKASASLRKLVTVFKAEPEPKDDPPPAPPGGVTGVLGEPAKPPDDPK